MGTLYDDDILQWSRQQSALLRRLAAGEKVNDQIDWENVAEEVDSVGRSELHAVESFLIQALAHRLKMEAFPGAKYPVARWQLDAEMFRQEAIQRFAPSMRQNLDIGKIYRRARRWVPAEIDGQPALPLPEQSPVTLDELLSDGG